jgi:hypothetical protein
MISLVLEHTNIKLGSPWVTWTIFHPSYLMFVSVNLFFSEIFPLELLPFSSADGIHLPLHKINNYWAIGKENTLLKILSISQIIQV